MAKEYTTHFHSKALKNVPIWDFWFEKIPSGNPVWRMHDAAGCIEHLNFTTEIFLRFIGKKFKFDTFPSIFCLLKTSKQNEN
jgi:hypothetical protein